MIVIMIIISISISISIEHYDFAIFRDVIPCDMVTFCDKTCLPEIL